MAATHVCCLSPPINVSYPQDYKLHAGSLNMSLQLIVLTVVQLNEVSASWKLHIAAFCPNQNYALSATAQSRYKLQIQKMCAYFLLFV